MPDGHARLGLLSLLSERMPTYVDSAGIFSGKADYGCAARCLLNLILRPEAGDHLDVSA
jgi:hypothetical protein